MTLDPDRLPEWLIENMRGFARNAAAHRAQARLVSAHRREYAELFAEELEIAGLSKPHSATPPAV